MGSNGLDIGLLISITGKVFPCLRKLPWRSGCIPSHDTFSRVFRTPDPDAFAGMFASFATTFGTAIGKDDVVSVDGKAMKRADEKGKQSAPRMMVTAWGARARMSLAARRVVKDDETNAQGNRNERFYRAPVTSSAR